MRHAFTALMVTAAAVVAAFLVLPLIAVLVRVGPATWSTSSARPWPATPCA